jgi:HK97 family phage portal protein
MRIFGYTITRAARPQQTLQPVSSWGGVGSGRGWFPLLVRDHYAGAWQRNDEIVVADVLSNAAVYACITLIASDIAKLRIKLVEQGRDDIRTEIDSAAFSPVLRKPNHYQTRMKFIERWLISKLAYGNTYVLKERDQRGVVVGLTVLDPQRVTPLVAPNGDVYYELRRDELAGVYGDTNVVVPAREIIHDLMPPLYHPLVGVSPIYACGLAAMQALKIQDNSAGFFANGSNPGGVLTAPGAIDDTTAQRLKQYWDTNYSGANVGKVAVLGDGLKYEAMAVNAVDAQLIEQLKWTSETVCACFHVPIYKVTDTKQTAGNVEQLEQQYYSNCLQAHIESLEACLDDGLELPKVDGKQYSTEFDLQGLLRMDTAAKVKAAAEAIGAGFLSPNEARRQFNLKPVKGGDTPYLQQQNFSLAALQERDQGDPFAKPAPAPVAPANDDMPPAAQAKAALTTIREGLRHV